MVGLAKTAPRVHIKNARDAKRQSLAVKLVRGEDINLKMGLQVVDRVILLHVLSISVEALIAVIRIQIRVSRVPPDTLWRVSSGA